VTVNYIDVNPEELEFVAVAEVQEIANGERLLVDFDEFSLVLFNIAGKFFAIGDVCSHDDGPIGEGDLDDLEIACPRHGAHFDVRDGKALSLPAVVDIPSYPVRITNGQIEVGVPLES
jgi:3-phenylpropionate/trans-cinnamate dioxygenase ferredoxin subunit